MYLLSAGRGWEQLPHAKTAVNNFLGLHAYDSRVYIPMGSWMHNQFAYAQSSPLAWGSACVANRQTP